MSFDLMALAYGTNIKKSPAQKLILLAVASNSNEKGISWWSNRRLAEYCSMSIRALQDNLKTLISLGYIDKKDRPNKTSIFKLYKGKMKKNQIKDAETNAKTIKLAQGINPLEQHVTWDVNKEQPVDKFFWGADSACLGVQNLHPNQLVKQSVKDLTTISEVENVDNLPTEPEQTEKPEPKKEPDIKYQKPAHGFTHITDKNMSAPTKNHPFKSQAKKQGGNKPEFQTGNGKDPAILAHQEMMQHAPMPEETEAIREKALQMVGIKKE